MASVSASDGLPHQPLCASDGLPHQSDGLPHQSDCLPHQSDGLPHQSDGLPHQSDGLPHQVRDWEKPITAEDNCVFICVASTLDPNAAPEGHHVHASPPARNQLCDDLFEADCETDCET